jgi:cysteine desulfurase/selenocysteine lyase
MSLPSMHRPAAAAFDVERVRADFPILAQEVNGRPLAYLDNAASSQRPRVVIDAIARYYAHDHANVHRGVHTLSQRATEAYEHARREVQRFVNAASASELIFVRGTTEAINLVAQSYGRPRLGAGDEVLITWMEHHSNIVPWQLLCEQTGATLRVAPITDAGELDIEAFARLLGPRTRIVAFTHVSNAVGTINPVRELVRMARAAGAVSVIDGAQAAPHLAIDVRAIGCDFYAFSSHKMYGPTGIGVLYGRADLLESMPPYQGGGEMIRAVSFERTTYAPPPARFEAGTPHIAGAVGLAAAIEYVRGLGLERIARAEHELLDYATARLSEIPGLRIVGTARAKTAVLSFVLEGIHPHDIGTVLDHHGVAVRTGHHCAMPLMERFAVPATTRASFAFYNTRAEVDQLADALRAAREVLG